MSEFYWDSEAWEVRNADRSMWLRRTERFFHGRHDCWHTEKYIIFEPDFSIGFRTKDLTGRANLRIEVLPEFVEWTRDKSGRAITMIDWATDLVIVSIPKGRLEELGPIRAQERQFDSIARQERFLNALPDMLSVLPELRDKDEENQALAAGRIGYTVQFSDRFNTALNDGRYLK